MQFTLGPSGNDYVGFNAMAYCSWNSFLNHLYAYVCSVREKYSTPNSLMIMQSHHEYTCIRNEKYDTFQMDMDMNREFCFYSA